MPKELADVIIADVFQDEKVGTIFRVKTVKEYFDFRSTPSGLLRVGHIKKRGIEEHIVNPGRD